MYMTNESVPHLGNGPREKRLLNNRHSSFLVRGTTPNGGVDGWTSRAAHVTGAAIPNVLQPGTFVWFEKIQRPLVKMLPVSGSRPMKQLAVRVHFLRCGGLLIHLNPELGLHELTDASFIVPRKIDLLIGAEAFFDIIKEGIRTSGNGLASRSSVFGYTATGTTISCKQNQYCGFISKQNEIQNIDDSLQKFWEIETINEGQDSLGKEEEYCENPYQMTHAQ
ncbi:uncharacterized protein TNCV_3523201 [Trichonephila clavipes]|uniref:Peptidase aspartic putative domain-containing protein n=1 Tax=Trichonephila clavipes TaxID=2585209 RepID=A0A8X7BHH7_TRICX|nr:uncharacterized protein TNCV_3523201 [Trichonephila clavipes]